jgi:hypothetical protein
MKYLTGMFLAMALLAPGAGAQTKFATDVLALNPLGYWRLDGTPNDSTGKANNGALLNGVTFSGAGGGAPIGDPGGQAAVFNGAQNQLINIPAGEPASGTAFDLDWNQPMTVMAWVKTTNTTNSLILLAK